MIVDNSKSEFSGIVHHFTILAKKQIGDGEKDFILKEWDGYITTIESTDGQLVGVDVKIAKAGSKTSGLLDGWARMFTCALNHGADVSELCQLAMYTQFVPFGSTKNIEIPKCSSILDYASKYISMRYCKPVVEESVA